MKKTLKITHVPKHLECCATCEHARDVDDDLLPAIDWDCAAQDGEVTCARYPPSFIAVVMPENEGLQYEAEGWASPRVYADHKCGEFKVRDGLILKKSSDA